MNSKRYAIWLCAIITLFSLSVSVVGTSYASPKSKSIQRFAKKIRKLENKIDKLMSKLSAAKRAKVRQTLLNKSFDDSDFDGVPDALDSGKCDSDSDDDGYDDSAEIDYDETSLVKIEGELGAVSESLVTVSGLSCAINSSTELEDQNDNIITLNDFVLGEYVELKCVEIDGSLVAIELEKELEDDSSDDEDDEDDED